MPSAVLLTRHQKATWIASALAEADFQIVEHTGFDTDQLGTFSGQIKRKKDAKATAEHKAKLACELTQSRYGLGSEGSFFLHPIANVTWEQEFICLLDSKKNKAVFGVSEGPATVTAQTIESTEAVHDIGLYAGEQKWMWQDTAMKWHKALTLQDLHTLITDKKVTFPFAIVPDYRAMHCPGRQTMIAHAANNLVHRLMSVCPQCGATDFVYEKPQTGLPCSACSLPTTQAKGWWAECAECGYKNIKAVSETHADPVNCAFCNP